MIKVVLCSKPAQVELVFSKLQIAYPKLKGLSIYQLDDHKKIHRVCSLGEAYIVEKIGHIKLLISAECFFQINSQQTERLYQAALELAKPTKEDFVIDAFSGVGGLGLFFATQAQKVLGLEKETKALEQAFANAKLNGLNNLDFKQADLEKNLAHSLKSFFNQATILIVDPPRQGLNPNFVGNLKKLTSLTKILYVSCDPATLCRDLKALTKLGFKAQHFIPFDLFPQTTHLETICLLTKT